jgi:hypothetical protein
MSTDEELKKHKIRLLSCFEGASFQLADYSAPSADWDHDHCEGCTAKFAEFDGPEILHSGYFTICESGIEDSETPEFIEEMQEQGCEVMAKPDAKSWVCKECFEEFRTLLNWELDSTI